MGAHIPGVDEASGWSDASAGSAPGTMVRVYHGTQTDAARTFEADAKVMADYGYTPISQSWAAGEWGCGAWGAAIVSCFLLVGFFVILYLLIVKPEGTLTVTYRRAEPAASSPPATVPGAALSGRLAQLADAKAAGLITDEEYEARRKAILDSH